MTCPEFRQECPTCHGHGIVSVHGGLPEEAVVCPLCDGRGWLEVRVKRFEGRPPRRPGVKVIRRSLARCPPRDAERTGNWMTYDEFEQFFPASPRGGF